MALKLNSWMPASSAAAASPASSACTTSSARSPQGVPPVDSCGPRSSSVSSHESASSSAAPSSPAARRACRCGSREALVGMKQERQGASSNVRLPSTSTTDQRTDDALLLLIVLLLLFVIAACRRLLCCCSGLGPRCLLLQLGSCEGRLVPPPPRRRRGRCVRLRRLPQRPTRARHLVPLHSLQGAGSALQGSHSGAPTALPHKRRAPAQRASQHVRGATGECNAQQWGRDGCMHGAGRGTAPSWRRQRQQAQGGECIDMGLLFRSPSGMFCIYQRGTGRKRDTHAGRSAAASALVALLQLPRQRLARDCQRPQRQRPVGQAAGAVRAVGVRQDWHVDQASHVEQLELVAGE